MRSRQKAAWFFLALLLVAAAALLFGHKQERVRLLYVSNGQEYDQAAYLNMQQSIVVGADIRQIAVDKLSRTQLRSSDAVYLDVSLRQSRALQEHMPLLERYVAGGGHLFVENELLPDLPLDLLGAAALEPVRAPKKPLFDYPETRTNVRGIQSVIREYADSFASFGLLGDMDSMMPGFHWGDALVPSTAEPIVSLDGQTLYAINRYGAGTVFSASAFLPNRYFITGFDLESGMDPDKGFAVKAAAHDLNMQRPGRSLYFGFKTDLPQAPYFHFAFAAANHLLRNEYIAYVSKETIGYSVKKVYGPYGRPAMAYQNHFEALPAIAHKEGIAWAELLKTYNQIPTFSLVRSSFDWHHWYEGITVHLNTGTTEQPQFVGEYPNSFYSSGTLVTSEGSPLTLGAYPGKNQLGMKLPLPYRAYPAWLTSSDGSGELIVGSADGYLYRYPNVGPQPTTQMVPSGISVPDSFGKPQQLRLTNGQTYRAGGGYAAVATADLTGDGQTDLVVGGGDGRVIVLRGRPNGSFQPPIALTSGGQPIRVGSHAAPAIGDVTGDGIADLVVGDAEGNILLYPGLRQSSMQFGRQQKLFTIRSGYAAPSIRDMNGDGVADLVIGNSEGDLLVYVQQSGEWLALEPIVGSTNNQMGTKALVGGQYSVPLWLDLNHDGREDLVVGQLQYSKPYPIDDPAFPYQQELREFLDYANENKLEIIPHVYMHSFLSSDQEKLELQLHRQAFAALGLPWTATGTNQHTWRINQLDRLQTLRNENEADIWYNFGFKPADSPTEPQWGQDFIWSFPFLLEDSELKTPMLLYAPGFMYKPGEKGTAKLYESYARLDLPIDYFEHIEYQYEEPGKTAMLTEFVTFFDRLRTAHDYNFMTEPQMARSFLAAMTTDIRIERSWLTYALDQFKTRFGRGKHLTLSLTSDTDQVPALAEEYRDTAGIVLEPGERYEGQPFGTDSPIYTRKENRLYVGLGMSSKTQVSVSWAKEQLHLVRSNVPVRLDTSDEGWTIHLDSIGMQQIKLYAPRPLNIAGDQLKVEQQADENGYWYTVTHYGDKTSVTVTMPDD